jgi:hypothetical protein
MSGSVSGPWVLYARATLNILNGSIDLTNNTYTMTLLASSYTPNSGQQVQWSDVSINEIPTGFGYTQGGMILTGTSGLSANNTITFSCNSPNWGGFNATFEYGVIVRQYGATLGSGDQLICYADLGGGTSLSGGGGNLQVMTSTGVFQIVIQ